MKANHISIYRVANTSIMILTIISFLGIYHVNNTIYANFSEGIMQEDDSNIIKDTDTIISTNNIEETSNSQYHHNGYADDGIYYEEDENDNGEVEVDDESDLQYDDVTNENNRIIDVQTDEYGNTYMPVIIGAGRGTTGTHLMTEATCLMGYPSIHFNIGCIPKKTDIEYQSNSKEFFIPHKYVTLQYMTQRLSGLLTVTARCISSGHYCQNRPASIMREKLKTRIKDLVVYTQQRFHRTIAFHDYPFHDILPTLLEAIYEVNAKHPNKTGNEILLKPVILLSERDPDTYVTRRIERRHSSNDLVCKNPIPISSSRNEDGMVIVQGGAFDFIGCLNRAFEGLQPSELHNLTVADVFTTIKNATQTGDNSNIAQFVRAYQDSVRNIADFHYDMFVQKTRSTKKSVAKAIVTNTTLSHHEWQQSCQYINFWKRKKISAFF